MSKHDDCMLGEPCVESRPDECPPTIAERKRDKGEPWFPLIERREGLAGLRHYLDGKPIHCGSGLMLQSIDYRSDDYGEFARALPKGTRVRYEARISATITATLHADVGGHEFVARVEPWMRFRWPEERRFGEFVRRTSGVLAGGQKAQREPVRPDQSRKPGRRLMYSARQNEISRRLR